MEVIHNKTGEVYTVLNSDVINATNGREKDEHMVLYKNSEGMHFVRSHSEFIDKFTEE